MRKPAKAAKALRVADRAERVVPADEFPLQTICGHCGKIFPYASLGAWHVADMHPTGKDEPQDD